MFDPGARATRRGGLAETSRLAGSLVEATHDGIVSVDEHGMILSWNAGAERMFGHAAEDVIGRSLDVIVPEALRGEHAAGMRRLVGGGAPRLIGKAIEVPAVRADGSEFPIEMRICMWRDGGRTLFGAVIRDVSDRRRAQDRLHSLAHFDQLTMLPNRNLFLARVKEAIGEDGGRSLAVLIMDLDKFSEVNDGAGHAAGDRLIRETAVALKRALAERAGERSADPTVARIGPNQFGVVLPDEGDVLAAVEVADRLRAVARTVAITQGAYDVTASVGVTVSPEHGRTAPRILANADFALRRAKLDGGDRRQLFLPAQRKAAVARRTLETELKRAWAADEFEVFYQPQVFLADRTVMGAEALLRWRHPDRGVLAPGAFIHVLAACELAEQVGDWTLETACRQAAAWRRLTGRPFRMGANLFERQLVRPDMADRVRAALDASGLPPQDLEIEITENVMTASEDAAVRRVRRLRDLGVGIAFDDYGTGYASLSLLKRYPITRLKIDRSFVRGLSVDKDDAAIVELILNLGHRFGFGVIAEGIEEPAQASHLMKLGCAEGQGFLYGRPMTADAFEALLPPAPRRPKADGALVA